MRPGNMLLASVLLAITPALASGADDDRKQRFKEHLMERQQMGMEMMQMLSETMRILRDLDHRPSASEKEKLDEMIKRLDAIMETHKQMGDQAMRRMENMMNEGSRPHGMRDDIE